MPPIMVHPKGDQRPLLDTVKGNSPAISGGCGEYNGAEPDAGSLPQCF